MQISICVYNLENFYIDFQDFIADDITPIKPEAKLNKLKEVFEDIDADIYCLSEVGGIRSLENFNLNYLQSKYLCLLEKGNSDRGIEVAYLLKKDKFEKFLFKSNKDRKFKLELSEFNIHQVKHSRDIVELTLFCQEKPIFTILNTHLKSQRESYSEDFRGQKRRGAEFKLMIDIYQEISSTYQDIPIFLTGDFNGNASRFQTDREFQRYLIEYDLIDALELNDLPREERATYYIFNHATKIPVQLDYCLLPKKYLPLLEDAVIYRYKSDTKSVKFSPRSRLDVLDNPSDHYPYVIRFNLPSF